MGVRAGQRVGAQVSALLVAKVAALVAGLLGAGSAAAAPWGDPNPSFEAFSLDPDAPVSSYRVLSGRHESKLGTRLAAPSIDGPNLRQMTTLDAFFALENWSRSYPISYQTLRANVGIDTAWALPGLDARLPAGGGLVAQLGWFHESDHVTDTLDFAESQSDPRLDPTVFHDQFDWANFSSYELLRGRLRYAQPLGLSRWTLFLTADGRRYLEPINPAGGRALTVGWAAEGRLSLQLSDRRALYAAARVDRSHHGLDPRSVGLKEGAAPGLLRQDQAELGVDLRSDGPRVQLAALGRRGDGRGADFVADYGLEWGLGLRLMR
jgi:hypothetical protein